VSALAADAAGNLWVASDRLFLRRPDGRFEQVSTAATNESPYIIALAADRRRVWMTTFHGLWAIESPSGDAAVRPRRLLEIDTVPGANVAVTKDGGVWLASQDAVLELDETGTIVRRIAREQGLLVGSTFPLLVDRRGDFWTSPKLGGVQRLVSVGVTSFGEADGLEARLINAIFRTRSGELVAFGHPHVPQHLDRGRFTTVHPTMPASVRGPGWGWYQIDLQDRFGGWWIASGNGVVRFPAVGRLEDLERTRAVEVLAWRGC